MKPTSENVFVTSHAIYSYIKRATSDLLKDRPFFSNEEDITLKQYQFKMFSKSKEEIKGEIVGRILKSSENKSFINDSKYMEKLYNQYGYDIRPRIFCDHELVYICYEKGCYAVVYTCLKSHMHASGRQETYSKIQHKPNKSQKVYRKKNSPRLKPTSQNKNWKNFIADDE